MEKGFTSSIVLHPEVKAALRQGIPVVALETAVMTHGLPRPLNLELAIEMETILHDLGVVPATIGMIAGKVYGGLTREQMVYLADASNPRKISQRDFGVAMALGDDGGTTVAGTLIAAQRMGIRVFATGGIGGVHRNAPFDISADLPALGRTPIIVVCAGAKAILDLPATLEYLETMGVPVLGYQTDEFPAFYSTTSGMKVSQRVDTPERIAEIAHHQENLGLPNALLVVVPPPQEDAIPAEEIEQHIEHAVNDAFKAGIKGFATTPYLLARIGELSGGRSLRTNLALLKNNARVAAQIAKAMNRTSGSILRG